MNGRDDMDEGWNRSAGAWLALMARDGDFSRTHVLDAPTLARTRRATRALYECSSDGRSLRVVRARRPPLPGLSPATARAVV